MTRSITARKASTLPHPPWRVPVLGDVIGADRTTPVQDSLRYFRQLGPVFTRKVMDREIMFVCDADLVADLSDESRFDKHVGLGVFHLREVVGDGLFTAHNHEPNWRKAHDILLPAFALSSMHTYHPTMIDVARQLMARWDIATGPVDVTADTTRLTLETIGRAGFGYSFNSFEREEPDPFVNAMVGGLRYAQQASVRLPGIGRIGARRRDAQHTADVAYMTRVVDEVVARRRGGPAPATPDLLGLMLDSPHPATGELLDEVNIRNQVITFLIAGHETTSGALSFALYFLSKHPEVLTRAQAEVDALWGSADDPAPDYRDVAKLRYVRRVLDEALRLWPTAPAFIRAARRDTVLGHRYPMGKGQWALVFIPGLHRDPVWGPDPDLFDPDRFTPEQIKARPGHAYKPFGTGERACIGRQFAIHESVLVLGLLLHRYRFTGDPAYELRVQELLTLKPEGFRLSLQRRKPADRG